MVVKVAESKHKQQHARVQLIFFIFFNSMVNHHLYTVQTSITVIIHSIPANKGRWVTILTAHFIVFAWRNPIHIFNFQLIYFTYLIFRDSFLEHFKVNIPNILLNRWYIGSLRRTNNIVSSTKYGSVWQKNHLKFLYAVILPLERWDHYWDCVL